MIQSSSNQNQCCHSHSQLTQTSLIEFCEFCREIRPSNRYAPSQIDTDLCYHHNKKYQNVCIACGILLCKQCQLLTHPYNHQVLSVNKFIQKIIDYSEKQGPQNFKEAYKNQHSNIFRNRQIVAKLQRRLKLLTYKQLEFAQQKKQSMAELKKMGQSYQQKINQIASCLKQLQQHIACLISIAQTDIQQIYLTKSKIAQKQALCLLYFKDPQKKTEIDIANFILQHWNQLDQAFRHSGLSINLTSLFQPGGKKVKKSLKTSIQLSQQIDNDQGKIISNFERKAKKQLLEFDQHIHDFIHSSNEKFMIDKVIGLQTSIFTEYQKSPGKGREPVHNVMSALGSIINRKQEQNTNQNKENFTIKLNSSKKSSRNNLSTTKNSLAFPPKTSYFDQSTYSFEKSKQFILYGGVNNKSLLEVYNPVDTPKTSLQANTNSSLIPATQHQQFGVAPNIFNSRSFFVFGGRMHGQPIDCIFEIAIRENRRQLIGHLSESKSNFGICYSKQSAETETIRVYIAGGANETGDPLRTFEITQIYPKAFKNKLNERITHKKMEPMNIKRNMLSLSVHKNHLYAIGGSNDSYRALNSVERISLKQPLKENKWEQIGDLNEERCMHSSISVRSGLYCIGGWNQSHYLDSIEKLDQNYMIFRTIFRMKTSRSLFGLSSYEGNEKMIVFGGLNQEGGIDTCEVLDPKKKNSSVLSKRLSEPKYYFGCLSGLQEIFE